MINPIVLSKYVGSQKNLFTKVLAYLQMRLVSLFTWGKVLDIGCGTGAYQAAMSYRCEEFKSCDIVKDNTFGIPMKICPANDLLWYKDNYFDTVLMIGVIEHLQFPGMAISEIKRVKKRTGQVIFCIPNGIIWKICRPFLRGHLRMHADWDKDKLEILYGQKADFSMPIIPGLFWLCIFRNYY